MLHTTAFLGLNASRSHLVPFQFQSYRRSLCVTADRTQNSTQTFPVTHETPHQKFESRAQHDNSSPTRLQGNLDIKIRSKEPYIVSSIENDPHNISERDHKMPSPDPPPAKEAPKPAATEASQPQKEKKGALGKQTKDPATPTDIPKLSGAELKKKAKEEKAARRAQALAEKQSGGPAQSPVTTTGPGQKPNAQQGQKGAQQQKRRGSTAGEAKILALRSGQKSAPVVEVPKEEDKTVEFFRHLYKTRTTSIAGASKEVHPAVLALGLQMSNYTICGSCARLVATLQAFKKVSSVLLDSTFLLCVSYVAILTLNRSSNHILRLLETLSLGISHLMSSLHRLTIYHHVDLSRYQWEMLLGG